MSSRKNQGSEPSPSRLLLWVAIAGLIFGLIGLGELPEDLLRSGRNSLHLHKASGDIVFVSIDDPSLRDVGRWPWPRQYHAQITDKLMAAGANRVFFDVMFENRSNPTDDAIFVESLKRSGRVTLPIRLRSGPDTGPDAHVAVPAATPLEMFSRYAKVGTISVWYNYQNAVWHLPYALKVNNQLTPSFAASLANRRMLTEKEFTPDYSIIPSTIPSVPAATILHGNFPAALVRGKDVVIGTNSEAVGDQYFIPGVGKMGGAYVQIIGAETLKAGTPVSLGWIPAFLLALGIAFFGTRHKNPTRQNLIFGAAAAAFLFVPVLLEANLIRVDITPGLFILLTCGAILAWRGFRVRGLVNSVSGLPNLNALRLNKVGRNQALIVARILNYSEIVATLPAESERQLIEQIVGRLSVGSRDRIFYHGDGGILVWFEEPRLPFGNHIDALYSLFRNPVRVGGLAIDLAISFGVEIGSGRSLGNRLGSALVAAEEAAHDGLKWKFHDPESLQDASWKLSILSQLDSAIDKGEVWVAYQPKLDLASNQIIGAEALARWTHPEKGPIAATEFVAAAEQHDRIGKLTDFVLDKAVAAGASIVRQGREFNIAVNLSARLLTDRNFTLRLSALLARHRLDARHLTLELTETAALVGSGESVEMLGRLRELGVNISIDDYGTGLSTLEYLKKIPAGEIKIDQSFVKAMCDNRSDRLMVQSTIALAHSLGRKVVAEGVEQQDILEALTEMKCDVAQGYIIGRPMSLESLIKRLTADRKRDVA
ncbi:EAL domain-containing protein [Sphingomonas sp.]|uniref:EAL domain-containing protein n=1 Tax=Sphingomonas sp. TaxID=28214 RepID=UPI00286A818A|nr:EAL domain-containing protein [Sphingomonas sp.]